MKTTVVFTRLQTLLILLLLIPWGMLPVQAIVVPSNRTVIPPTDCGMIIQPCFKTTYLFTTSGAVYIGNNYGDNISLIPSIVGFVPTRSNNATAYLYSATFGGCTLTLIFSAITSVNLQFDAKWSGCPTGFWTLNLARVGGGAFRFEGCALISQTIRFDFCNLKVSGGSLTWTGIALRITVTSSNGYIDPASIVQTTGCTGSAVSTISCSVANTVTPYSILFIGVAWNASVSAITITDNSAQYIQQGCITSANQGMSAVYWTSAANGGFTISWTTATNVIVQIIEAAGTLTTGGNFGGVQCGTATGTSTAPALGNNMLTITANGFAFAMLFAANPSSYTAGSGFTIGSTSTTGAAEYEAGSALTSTCPLTLGTSVKWALACLMISAPNEISASECINAVGSATTLSCTTNQYFSPNALYVACAGTKGAQAAPTISDTLLHTWTSIATVTNTAWAQCWYTKIINPGSSDVVTVSGTLDAWGMATFLSVGITSNGFLSATNTGTGTSFSVATQTLSTTSFGYSFTSAAGNIGTKTAGSGWSLIVGGGVNTLTQRRLSFTPQTTTCPATGTTSQNWATICAIFPEINAVSLIVEPGGTNTAALSSNNYFTTTITQFGVSNANWIINQGTTTNTRLLFVQADPATNWIISATSTGSTSTRQWAFYYSNNVASAYNLAVGSPSNAPSRVTLIVFYYEAFKHTIQITPSVPNVWDAGRIINVACLQAEVFGTCASFTPAAGSGAQSSAVFTDNVEPVEFEPSTGGIGTWTPTTIRSANLGTPGGDTVNSDYSLLTQQDPPNYLWLLLIPIGFIGLLASKRHR